MHRTALLPAVLLLAIPAHVRMRHVRIRNARLRPFYSWRALSLPPLSG